MRYGYEIRFFGEVLPIPEHPLSNEETITDIRALVIDSFPSDLQAGVKLMGNNVHVYELPG